MASLKTTASERTHFAIYQFKPVDICERIGCGYEAALETLLSTVPLYAKMASTGDENYLPCPDDYVKAYHGMMDEEWTKLPLLEVLREIVRRYNIPKYAAQLRHPLQPCDIIVLRGVAWFRTKRGFIPLPQWARIASELSVGRVIELTSRVLEMVDAGTLSPLQIIKWFKLSDIYAAKEYEEYSRLGLSGTQTVCGLRIQYIMEQVAALLPSSKLPTPEDFSSTREYLARMEQVFAENSLVSVRDGDGNILVESVHFDEKNFIAFTRMVYPICQRYIRDQWAKYVFSASGSFVSSPVGGIPAGGTKKAARAWLHDASQILLDAAEKDPHFIPPVSRKRGGGKKNNGDTMMEDNQMALFAVGESVPIN